MSKEDCLKKANNCLQKAKSEAGAELLVELDFAAIYFLAAGEYEKAIECYGKIAKHFSLFIGIRKEYLPLIKALRDPEQRQKLHSLLFAEDSPIPDKHLGEEKISREPFFKAFEHSFAESLSFYVLKNALVILGARCLLHDKKFPA